MASTDERYRVQSLGRGLDLLDHIARRGREGARLTDLARELSLSKAACYAMLQTLIARGFVTDKGKGIARRYRLGMTLARLGEQTIDSIALPDVAVPALRDLTAEVNRTSRVAVFDEGYAVVIGRIDAPGAIRFDAALGRRELPHCTAVGKALLASLPAAEAREILSRTGLPRRTPQTITSVTALMKDLARIAQRGYAIDDEEDTEGVQCIGACVFDRSGKAAGAISVTGLKQRSRDGDLERVAAAVIRYADRISQELGGPTAAEVWARPVGRKVPAE
jgi:IclR family transcriptional regulator, acetate operon repressor